MSDFPIRPKLLRGAFVEYGLSLPPLLFGFQFNPETLTRGRTATWTSGAGSSAGDGINCRDSSEEQARSCLAQVTVSTETIGLTLHLDATEDLNEDGQTIARNFGIGPQLSVLELMIYPKTDQLLGFPIGNLLGSSDQFGAAQAKTIPILLFVWGRKRVLPVVMTSLQITEQEFFPDLNPRRADVAVQLQVLEGFNPPYLYSHAWRMGLAAMNLANIGDLADSVL